MNGIKQHFLCSFLFCLDLQIMSFGCNRGAIWSEVRAFEHALILSSLGLHMPCEVTL